MTESKIVLQPKVNGVKVIGMPITRLDCVEDTAETKTTSVSADYIPIIDSEDNSQMKKISVANLIPDNKAAIENAQTTADNAATAAANAQTTAENAATAASEAKSAASAAQTASKPVSFSVATSKWTSSTDYTGYNYYADVTVSGMTSNDSVDVRFSMSSMSVCTTAEIAGACVTNSGSFRLYAKSKPTASVSGVYLVQKGE